MKSPIHGDPRRATPMSHADRHPRTERYLRVRNATVALTAPLSAEDCAIQSMTDASPAKWHLAHTTWFFETFILSKQDPQRPLFNSSFRVLFNSYYNSVGDKHPRPQRGLLSRPSLAEVLDYRRHVDGAIISLIERDQLDAALAELVDLGIEHEQQHQELILTDVKHLLSCNPLRPAYQRNWPLTPIHPHALHWIWVAGGERKIGHGGDGVSFDNERPRHSVWIHDFEIASQPVSHGDFVDFIDDGGYRRPELWLSAGPGTVFRPRSGAPRAFARRGHRPPTFPPPRTAPVGRNTPLSPLSFFQADPLP